jgi:iron(III) transport system substrate-binding protein
MTDTTRITRRGALATALLLGAALAGPAAAQQPALSTATRTLYEAAKKDGELTWYVSHYNGETAEAIGRDFTRVYPGVKVNVVRATAQVIFQRLSQDLKAGAANADVLSSTDASHFAFLKEKKLLATYRPENADSVYPLYRNMDPDNQFHATHTAMLVIVYRSDKVDEASAPKSWQDLLDPRFKGKLAFGHPGYSGLVGAWAVSLDKKFGWSYFEKLKANQPQVGRSINDVKTMLDSGERAVGSDGDGYFRKKQHEGSPYRTVYPADGAVVVLSGTGVMAHSTKPNAARLFANFLISKEAQQGLVTRDWSPAMRPDVPASPGAKTPDEVPTMRVGNEDMEALTKLRERWRDTFGS